MTGRQDVLPAPSIKAGNIYKNLQEDVFQKQDLTKQSLRSSQIAKSPKPTLELYKPPKICQKNGTKVHFQMGTVRNKGSPPPASSLPIELKSALKRSKSFTSSETSQIAAIGFDKDAFPLEYQVLIRRATLDPNTLSCQQLMELVRLICSKAIENIQYSSPAAHLCFSIIEKEHDNKFLESLINCCREWYNERDKLLRSSFMTNAGMTVPGSRRWTAYVSFLAELYLQVKSQLCQTVHGQASGMEPHPNSPMAHLALTLLALLYDSLSIILKPPSVNNVGEMECLRTILLTVGKQLELDSPLRMQQMVCHLRDAFVNPSINAQIRKTLLEVVELHASGWQLDLPQMMYYFPYTSFDRK